MVDIKQIKCGNYTVQNNTVDTITYTIYKLTYTDWSTYTSKLASEFEVAAGETLALEIIDAGVYTIEGSDDPTDKLTIVESCRAEQCMTAYINRLLCCKSGCLKCDETCTGTEWLGTFNAVSILYVLYKDIIEGIFNDELIFYFKDTEAIYELHHLDNILLKMEELCDCTMYHDNLLNDMLSSCSVVNCGTTNC